MIHFNKRMFPVMITPILHGRLFLSRLEIVTVLPSMTVGVLFEALRNPDREEGEHAHTISATGHQPRLVMLDTRRDS